MRILSILLFISLGLIQNVVAQVDILTARADPKTFIFDDEKHTVHGYIYNTLREKTSCCGNDAIYLEVKFDQTGTVTSAKTLTGKNECYKKSVVDIVYNVKWKAEGVSGTKTIYFEVKPILTCSGSPTENQYKEVPRDGGSKPVVTSENSNSGGKTEPEEELEEVVTVMEEVIETPPTKEEEVVREVVEEEVVEESGDGFLSEEFGSEESSEEEVVATKEAIKETAPVKSGKDEIKETVAVKSGKDEIKESVKPVVTPTKSTTPPVATSGSKKPSGPIKIPPQEKLEYVSKGDVKPMESHNTTFVNIEPAQKKTVNYDNPQKVAVNLRTELRKAGFCGLAHAVIEMETDPNTGQVVNTRLLKCNDPKVADLVPRVTSTMKFEPTRNASNRYVYTEFKAEITCNGEKPKYDLNTVDPYLVK